VSRGFGVAGGLDPEVATPLAARCQELGYASVWSNDTPIGHGIDTLAEFARGAERIDLGVTLALDRHPPEAIAADLERTGLDRDRLWLAVGAGIGGRPLTRMREALSPLREALPGVRLALAAMGPKMCRLAGAEWDGVFFNWVTPEFAASSRELVEAGAGEAGREPPPVLGYVRTAVGTDAEERLAKEESFYRDLHKGYRDHFDRLGEPEGTVGVAAENAGEAQTELSRYRALDTTVVRALASAKIENMSAVAEAAAPGD
jgi:alkanesulfonate monooxygenase SsuD/methylene tetrahydromethanopterin reductase-like flavin-dependent oxidoreductase (luciferase family)